MSTSSFLQMLQDTRPVYEDTTPVCDRCHQILNHNTAASAPTPSIHTIRAFLDESPYKENRIYHVVDAADFPISVIPNIYEALGIQEQRSRNRRTATEKYKWGKKLPTVDFVITRSDLLAPKKEQVDSLMEYMRDVLCMALRKSRETIRLGNVHMVSASRGWWTKKVKEEIQSHGGGIWVVGRANVGKSRFILACFPKDSQNMEKIEELVQRREREGLQGANAISLPPSPPPHWDSNSLLPPLPQEELYPVLPTVSPIPGTTISPIRIPFGRGKGEMIDLPGLERPTLASYIRDDCKFALMMDKRCKPMRESIKPGRSLLVQGGLVRITPTGNDVLLAASFLPFRETHTTHNDKATAIQAERRGYPGKKITKEGFGQAIASAGVFDLKYDVTNYHMPTSYAKAVNDRGASLPQLPYRVMAIDLLLEGCGWIELTMQVRRKSSTIPQVEVFSPHGQHVGSRPPIQTYRFLAQKRAADRRKHGARGRQNIGRLKRVVHSRK